MPASRTFRSAAAAAAAGGRLRRAGRRRLFGHRHRTGDRAGLSRRLHQAGHPARRPARQRSGSGAQGALRRKASGKPKGRPLGPPLFISRGDAEARSFCSRGSRCKGRSRRRRGAEATILLRLRSTLLRTTSSRRDAPACGVLVETVRRVCDRENVVIPMEFDERR